MQEYMCLLQDMYTLVFVHIHEAYHPKSNININMNQVLFIKTFYTVSLFVDPLNRMEQSSVKSIIIFSIIRFKFLQMKLGITQNIELKKY